MPPLHPQWWLPYVGGPYLWRGREPGRTGAGVDCFGLHAHVLRHDFGHPIDDRAWLYPSLGDEGGREAMAGIAAEEPHWRRVDWEEGALALFKVKGHPVHVGTCTHTPGVILHAHRSVGVDTLDVFNSVKWKNRLVGCYLPP